MSTLGDGQDDSRSSSLRAGAPILPKHKSFDDRSGERERTNSEVDSKGSSRSNKPAMKNLVQLDLARGRPKSLVRHNTLASGSTLPQNLEELKISQDKSRRSGSGSSTRQSVSMGGSDNETGQVISYNAEKVIGNGSFGVVFQATVVGSGQVVAIKKVLQDKRFKNRELQIMRMVSHPNIVTLKHCFYSNGDKDEVYLNLVLEFIPDTVYRVVRHYYKQKQQVPMLHIKLYTYQMCRSLAYIHACGICHRDIKPQNLLVDPASAILKLCDFGSAKCLVKGEPNVAYICSRYYRAPELIFGATDYTTNIDVWSVGCVMAELLLGRPLFPGDSGVDQLVEIIKVLGTPTKEEIQSMNPNYTDFNFPQIKAHPWSKVFKGRAPQEAIDLLTSFLTFSPTKRLHPLKACTHPFFDEIHEAGKTLENGKPLPPLYHFTAEELKSAPELAPRLVPPRARDSLNDDAKKILMEAIAKYGDYYDAKGKKK
eukprot:TRINITY_DN722_c0_g1_i1.p1 TRINITY_DN722_c0_g1~~TRINITY_DN722_c0_g1_i1.p1  ORF type:complete len:482 (-),score=72.68 TRINITY_DN722_c0_g1_i1:464-1909(-)